MHPCVFFIASLPVLFLQEQLALLKAQGKPRPPSNKKKWVRRKVVDWQGMLVAYEVFNWFKEVQQAGVLHEDIEWPDNDVLSAAMHRFKTESKLHTGVLEKLTRTHDGKGGGGGGEVASFDALSQRQGADPTGYLVDLKSAIHLGFLDDVFGSHAKVLDGTRLTTMRNWVEVLSYVSLFDRSIDQSTDQSADLSTCPTFTLSFYALTD